MFTHDQLVDYLNGFQGAQRETIYKSILDSNILEDAFLTPEGKILLNQTIDIITNNVIKIITECVATEPAKAALTVYPYCMEIGLAHKTLVSWAKVLASGDKHKKIINKKRLKEKTNG